MNKELIVIIFLEFYGNRGATRKKIALSLLLIFIASFSVLKSNAINIPQGEFESGNQSVIIKNDSIYFYEFYLDVIHTAPRRLIASCHLIQVNDSIFQITSDINPDKAAFKDALITSEYQDSIGSDHICVRFHTPDVKEYYNYEIKLGYFFNGGIETSYVVKAITTPVTEFIVRRNTDAYNKSYHIYPFSFIIKPPFYQQSNKYGCYYGILYLTSDNLNWRSFEENNSNDIDEYNCYDIILPNLNRHTFFNY